MMWSFSLREPCGEESDSDNENDPISETTLINEFDIGNRQETVEYKPNPWSIARVNAAARSTTLPVAEEERVSASTVPTPKPKSRIAEAFEKQSLVSKPRQPVAPTTRAVLHAASELHSSSITDPSLTLTSHTPVEHSQFHSVAAPLQSSSSSNAQFYSKPKLHPGGLAKDSAPQFRPRLQTCSPHARGLVANSARTPMPKTKLTPDVLHSDSSFHSKNASPFRPLQKAFATPARSNARPISVPAPARSLAHLIPAPATPNPSLVPHFAFSPIAKPASRPKSKFAASNLTMLSPPSSSPLRSHTIAKTKSSSPPLSSSPSSRKRSRDAYNAFDDPDGDWSTLKTKNSKTKNTNKRVERSSGPFTLPSLFASATPRKKKPRIKLFVPPTPPPSSDVAEIEMEVDVEKIGERYPVVREGIRKVRKSFNALGF